MSTPDANGWIKGIESADKEDFILVCVPCATEDGLLDYQHSTAWWDTDDERWDGEWRYVDTPGAEALEPSHWKPLDLPVEFLSAEAA